jgi:AcrR family transcriptional regulator
MVWMLCMKRKRARTTVNHAPAVGEMSERLAASAFKLFSQRGINNVSVDDIAADAKVTKGSLYWHYDSKDALIKAACTHYYRGYHRRINNELAHISAPAKRLERTLHTAVGTCLVDRKNRIFTTEIFNLAAHDEELRRSWRQFSDQVREFYIGLVKAATGLSTKKAEGRADFLLSAMEGLKLRAQYEPHLCISGSHKAIVAQLKRVALLHE